MLVKEFLELFSNDEVFDVKDSTKGFTSWQTDLSRSDVFFSYGEYEIEKVFSDVRQDWYDTWETYEDEDELTSTSIIVKPVQPDFKFGDKVVVNSNAAVIPQGITGIVHKTTGDNVTFIIEPQEILGDIITELCLHKSKLNKVGK